MRPVSCSSQFVFVLSLFFCTSAEGATIYQVEATNLTNFAVYDIHVAFTGTGGGLTNAMPLVPISWTAGITGGNTVDGDWNNTVSIGIGGIWRAQFTSELDGIVPAGGFWTDQFNQRVQGGDIPANDIKLTALPEPNSSLLMLAMGASALVIRICCKSREAGIVP